MALDDEGRLRLLATGAPALRRQDKLALFARNGPAILIVRREILERGKLYEDERDRAPAWSKTRQPDI